MTISMQGSWTVQVLAKNASFAQRFTIAGAATGNGSYVGDPSTPPVAVTGASWTISITHDPGTGYRASEEQIKFPVVVSTARGQAYAVDIESNDSGGDSDFDDLVLRCTTPVTGNDYLVAGHVSRYDERRCVVNPCSPRFFPVIDNLGALARALEIHELKSLIELRYPGIANAEPSLFRPIVLPLGEASLPAKVTADLPIAPAIKRPAAFDRVAAAARIDQLLRRCTSAPLPGFVLRFSEYDRTTAELTGGAYTGRGNRELLGTTATDRNGNYVFRFSRSFFDVLQEVINDRASGETVNQAAPPDVIIEVLDPARPGGVAFETAPAWNVPNRKQINICVPEGSIGPMPAGCSGGRVLQWIGNISLTDANNTFDGEGRITARATASGTPRTNAAAWAGSLWIFGCFGDDPAHPSSVTQFTLRYRRSGSSDPWQFVQEPYSYYKKADLSNPAQVGPWDGSVDLGGTGANKPAKVYLNIEQDPAWQPGYQYRKLILTSAIYAPGGGSVDFLIEGYDRNGARVASDTVTLYIDNTAVDYVIDDVQLGGTAGNDCALFTVHTATRSTPISVKFRANHRNGFMASYNLGITRGNAGTPIAVDRLAGSALTTATSASASFHGTAEDPAAHDAAGDVTATLQPTSSDGWLSGVPDLPGAPGVKFCTFVVSLGVSTRVTDGISYPSMSYGARQYYFGLQQLPDSDLAPAPPR